MNLMSSVSSGAWSRRDFVAATGAAGLVTAAMPAFAQEAAQRKIKLGIIGCGGRGRWLTGLFKKHGGYDICAIADYFEDRVKPAADEHGVPQERRFTGLDCHKKLLEVKPEAVAIITPPYFHPMEVADAAAAGAHVYLAKPLAVDVPGCQSIEATGKRMTGQKLCFLADFQTRAMEFYQEAIKRVHGGALGDIAFGEAYYHTDRIGSDDMKQNTTPEQRLRNWVFDKALSGDIITEQNIHTLDVMSWIFKTPPLHAFGTGGRKSRVNVGDCWDHFTLNFQYPGNVGVTFSSRQFDGFGSQPDGIVVRVFGSKGVLETSYGGNVMIRGKDDSFYRGGKTDNIYEDGAKINIATFYDSIVKGDASNPTLAAGIQSNLITIMGRKAAYTGKLVTWDETMKDTERLDGKLEGLKL